MNRLVALLIATSLMFAQSFDTKTRNIDVTNQLRFPVGGYKVGFTYPSSNPSMNLIWRLPSADAVGCMLSDGSLNLSIGSCTGGASTIPVIDTTALVKNVSDNTKLVAISAAAVSTATTRTLSAQNANYIIAGTNLAQTFSGIQTYSNNIIMNADILPGGAGSNQVGSTAYPFSTMVAAQFWARPSGGICNYAGVTITGPPYAGFVFAQDGSCNTQAQMTATGFDTVNSSGQYKIQGTTVIDNLRTLNLVATASGVGNVRSDLSPFAPNTLTLGTSGNPWNAAYIGQLIASGANFLGHTYPTTNNTFDLGDASNRWRYGYFTNLDINTGFKLGSSATSGYILTTDASGNGTWQVNSATVLPVVDTQTIVKNVVDTSKLMKFSLALLTTGTTRTLTIPDANITIAGINLAQTWSATQDFQDIRPAASSTYSNSSTARRWANTFTNNIVITSGFKIDASPTNGYVLTSDASGNGTWQAPSGALPVIDSTAIAFGSSDSTKRVRFEVDGFTSGATRVMTPPDADITVAGTNIAQTFTANQSFSSGIRTGGVSGVAIGQSSVNNRFGSAHIQNITSTTDANGTGAIYIRNSSGSLMGTLYDTNGNGGELQVNDNSGTNMLLINNSSFIFARDLYPSSSYTRSIGNTSARIDQYYGRFLNLRTNGSSIGGIQVRDGSNNLTFSMGDGGGTGGEFNFYNSVGVEYFGAINGQVRFNSQNGQTTSITIGACTMTFNQGGLTAKAGC